MGSCTLTGDLGQYTGPQTEMPGLVDFWESWELIDGRMAQLATLRNQFVSAAFQFQSSVYFGLVDSSRPNVSLRVSASCARTSDQIETLLLFRSIKLPEDPVNKRRPDRYRTANHDGVVVTRHLQSNPLHESHPY